MDQTDRRVRRTHKLLQAALIDLTLERGYESVTIRDITDRADVGYATFFRHYPDKEALLAEVLVVMKDEFQSLLAPYSMVSDPEKTGALLFEYVEQNRDLCRVLLNSTDTMSLLKPVQEIGMSDSTLMVNLSRQNIIPVDLAVSYLMSSLVMLIRWWLDHEMPYTAERMGQIAADLIIRPVMGAVMGDLDLSEHRPGGEQPA
jgi:AcrR family transcriptional regulator